MYASMWSSVKTVFINSVHIFSLWAISAIILTITKKINSFHSFVYFIVHYVQMGNLLDSFMFKREKLLENKECTEKLWQFLEKADGGCKGPWKITADGTCPLQWSQEEIKCDGDSTEEAGTHALDRCCQSSPQCSHMYNGLTSFCTVVEKCLMTDKHWVLPYVIVSWSSLSSDKNKPDRSTSFTPNIISKMAARSSSRTSPLSSFSYICRTTHILSAMTSIPFQQLQ